MGIYIYERDTHTHICASTYEFGCVTNQSLLIVTFSTEFQIELFLLPGIYSAFISSLPQGPNFSCY